MGEHGKRNRVAAIYFSRCEMNGITIYKSKVYYSPELDAILAYHFIGYGHDYSPLYYWEMGEEMRAKVKHFKEQDYFLEYYQFVEIGDFE